MDDDVGFDFADAVVVDDDDDDDGDDDDDDDDDLRLSLLRACTISRQQFRVYLRN